ncbi:metabotropic glutamate receptor 2-like [Engystomops pustulosus]|uniref:metabotropic glutamate receptor 2-like n=1 Tax=Engystomops pustulosus TaxID=76066 RepID=UPI003AFAC4B2
MEEFKKEAERHNICIATTVVMCYREDYRHDIENLKKHSRARVVVLIVNLKDLEHFLADSNRLNASFTWVVNTTWGSTEKIVEKYHKAVGRVIGVDTQSYPLPRFNNYFQRFYDKFQKNYNRLQLEKEDRRRERFNDYLYQDHTSFHSLYGGFRFRYFTDRLDLSFDILQPEDFLFAPKIQTVVNAVYAIAHALQNMSSPTCPNMSADCVREHNDTFMMFLKDISFNAPFSPPDVQYTVRFDEKDYGPARYNIFTIHEINGTFKYQQIGSWAEELTLNASHSMWESNTVPESLCGEPCDKHQVKDFDQGNPCCWDCTECLPNQIVINETTCKACVSGYWPNTDHNNCSKLPIDYIRWGDGLAIGSLSFSGLGILSTIFVGGVLLWNNNTPIVKASGREFCYILLSGVLLLYIMTFIFIARPSVVICGLRRLGLATSFAICYSALLTKTNRITRIFNSAQKGIAPPRYISLASQLFICLALITCQLLGLVIWLIVDLAKVIESVSSDKPLVILKCKSGDMKILLSLVYNVLLILLCTVYAFKTRKYPENFNEAKCIGFTMYTTCIIWLAFLPVFYITFDHPKVQVTTLCASISLCALVILGGLFVPKLYIIFCHPEKNVKRGKCVKPSSHTETSHDNNLNIVVNNRQVSATVPSTTEYGKFSPHLLWRSSLRSRSFHLMAAVSWTLQSLAILCSNGGHVSGDQSTQPELEIVGLFPVRGECYASVRHLSNKTKLCESVQLMEAMKFTTEEINRNSPILRIKLVSSPKILCRYHRIVEELNDIMKSKPVAAVIETRDDFISDEILDSLQGSEIPVIGCSATVLKLPKRPNLLRMVPPVQYQSKPIIDLLIHYNWTYVSIVASSGPTFISVMEEFKKEAESRRICFATTIVLCYREDYIQDIKNLQKHSHARWWF